MKKLFLWLTIAISITLTVIFLVLAKPTTAQVQSIVQIFITDSSNSFTYSSGSGVIIDDKLHIITNYHVVKMAVENSGYDILVCLTESDKKAPICSIKASIVRAIDKGYPVSTEELLDLALLKPTKIFDGSSFVDFETYKNKNNFAWPYVNFDRTNITKDMVELGDTIEILGYPGIGGNTITYTQGNVSGFEQLSMDDGVTYPWKIKTDANVNPGNSGGGAFDLNHNFIGIPSSVITDASSLGYIISTPTINLFLYLAGLSADLPQPLKQKTATELCQENFGNNSFSDNTLADKGGYNCYCNAGYTWNSSNTMCVKSQITVPPTEKSPTEISTELCRKDFGNNSYGTGELNSNGGYNCYCNTGYIWNSSNTMCVSDIQIPRATESTVVLSGQSPNEACHGAFGVNSYTLERVKTNNSVNCFCKATYVWNANRTGCVKEGAINSNTMPYEQNIDNENPFKDVSGHEPFSADSIAFLKSRGIITGYPDGTFRPYGEINRAEFTKIIVSSKESSIPEEFNNSCFKDVQKDQWFTKFVCYAKSKGYVSGYSNGTFGINNNVTYAEALKIAMIAYGLSPENTTKPWFSAYIDYADQHGLNLTGVDTNKQLMRFQVAELIAKIVRYSESL